MHQLLGAVGHQLSAMLVWIHMLPADGLETAAGQAGALHADGLRHFHDPRRRVGKALAPTVGADRAVVWDTYLFFHPDALWADSPPPPEDWAHQLHAAWADPGRHRWGDTLLTWLQQAAARPSFSERS